MSCPLYYFPNGVLCTAENNISTLNIFWNLRKCWQMTFVSVAPLYRETLPLKFNLNCFWKGDINSWLADSPAVFSYLWCDKYKYKLLKLGPTWVRQSTKSWRFRIFCQQMCGCTASTSREWPPSIVPIFLPNATLDILILTNSLACHKPFSPFSTFDRIKKRAFSYPFWTSALWAVLQIMIIFDLFASTALHTAQETFRHVLHFVGLGILVVSDFHLRWV